MVGTAGDLERSKWKNIVPRRVRRRPLPKNHLSSPHRGCGSRQHMASETSKTCEALKPKQKSWKLVSRQLWDDSNHSWDNHSSMFPVVEWAFGSFRALDWNKYLFRRGCMPHAYGRAIASTHHFNQDCSNKSFETDLLKTICNGKSDLQSYKIHQNPSSASQPCLPCCAWWHSWPPWHAAPMASLLEAKLTCELLLLPGKPAAQRGFHWIQANLSGISMYHGCFAVKVCSLMRSIVLLTFCHSVWLFEVDTSNIIKHT